MLNIIVQGFNPLVKKGRSMTNYYSKTKDELVNINDMHHQHVWYAFKKLCDRLEELGICEHIWEDDYAFWNQHKFVRKDVYELLFDKATRQDRTIEHYLNENSKLKKNANSRMVFKLEKEVSRLKQQINRMYAEQSHSSPRYQFSEIPNNTEGREFTNLLRKYLNKSRYMIRMRGQHLDNSKLNNGETWRDYQYGSPLSKSKCVRVYIDQKKEGK